MARPSRLLLFGILGAVLLTITLRSLVVSRARLVPVNDEVCFLDLACDFHVRGGPIATMRDYFFGRCTEELRHPLYMLFLSTFCDNTPSDFPRSKLFSLLLMLLLIVVTYYLVTIHWGWQTGLMSAVFLGLSPAATLLSQEILVDILFGFFYFSALVLLLKEDSRKNWVLFGVCSGLAYLTKGNGYFLFASAAVVGFLRHRWTFFKRLDLYIAVLAFVATASFLLVRNIKVFGAPFYNRNNIIFWLDAREQYLLWQDTPLWNQIGARWYFSTHTLTEAAARFLHGFSAMTNALIDAMAVGPKNIFFSFITGSVVMGLAIYGGVLRWRMGRKAEVAAFTVSTSILFTLFCWYLGGQEAHRHYTFPFALSLFPWAAYSLIHFVKDAKWLWGIVASAMLMLILMTVTKVSGNPLNYWAVPDYWSQTSTLVCRNASQAGYLIDNFSRYSTWDQCKNNPRYFPLRMVSPDLIQNFISRNQIKMVVLDMTISDPNRIAGVYGELDEKGPVRFFGWPRCNTNSASIGIFNVYAETCQ